MTFTLQQFTQGFIKFLYIYTHVHALYDQKLMMNP